jgi:hypothetical protein
MYQITINEQKYSVYAVPDRWVQNNAVKLENTYGTPYFVPVFHLRQNPLDILINEPRDHNIILPFKCFVQTKDRLIAGYGEFDRPVYPVNL